MRGGFPLAGPVLVIGAHPDDETIGVGGCLGEIDDVHIVLVTDGAPRSVDNPAAYAARRRQELLKAMAVVRIGANRVIELGIGDQQSSYMMAFLSRRIADLLIGRAVTGIRILVGIGRHFRIRGACAVRARRSGIGSGRL